MTGVAGGEIKNRAFELEVAAASFDGVFGWAPSVTTAASIISKAATLFFAVIPDHPIFGQRFDRLRLKSKDKWLN
jgi:hypothetical protein